MNVIDKNDPAIQTVFKSMDRVSSKLDELFKDYRPLLNGERYIPKKELAKQLGVCDRSLQEYRRRGMLPYIQNSKKVMYREADVERMLEKMYVKAWKL
ncbi:MAG: helix-turn-helix domain-containing protein [Prevotella sp.]|jgi:hypothetical protein|nr:helix-turn-helix domain-containing protein [Prevotella sp.]